MNPQGITNNFMQNNMPFLQQMMQMQQMNQQLMSNQQQIYNAYLSFC